MLCREISGAGKVRAVYFSESPRVNGGNMGKYSRWQRSLNSRANAPTLSAAIARRRRGYGGALR
jgi:hypothetical protein